MTVFGGKSDIRLTANSFNDSVLFCHFVDKSHYDRWHPPNGQANINIYWFCVLDNDFNIMSLIKKLIFSIDVNFSVCFLLAQLR